MAFKQVNSALQRNQLCGDPDRIISIIIILYLLLLYLDRLLEHPNIAKAHEEAGGAGIFLVGRNVIQRTEQD
jgi:hypothetical protein